MKFSTVFVFCLIFILELNAQVVSLEVFGSGFSNPVDIKNAGDTRLFVVEKAGVIKILNIDGTINETNFINITSRVGSSGNEQGLLGIAFHPDYSFVTGGLFFVNYTNTSGDTVISKFTIAANSATADDTSEVILMTIDQPYSNHNGGDLLFGPNGYLYIGTGDGGSGGDPENRAQDGSTLLGKMLRIDVDNGTPYAIPSDNPFVYDVTILDEIWSLGLRNPWKFSFDKNTGDIWIADVGQTEIEEINLTSSTVGGLNYGWRCYEGNSIYNNAGCPDISGMTFPIAQYAHSSGRCSITGGYKYRGSDFTVFSGYYFFADYCTNEIGFIDATDTVTFNSSIANGISTFGEDNTGELYVAGLNDGTIYKLIDPSLKVETHDYDNQINVYPNPVKGLLTIEISNDLQLLEIQFFNILGNRIPLKEKMNMETKTINLSLIPEGTYFIKFCLKNGEINFKKLIVL